MALTVFTPKAFIKCEEADASNYCYKQENKMKAGKMNDFYIDLEEKKLWILTILKMHTNKCYRRGTKKLPRKTKGSSSERRHEIITDEKGFGICCNLSRSLVVGRGRKVVPGKGMEWWRCWTYLGSVSVLEWLELRAARGHKFRGGQRCCCCPPTPHPC